MKERSDNQKHVIAILKQRGAYLTADATESHWRNGKHYYLDSRNIAGGGINVGSRKAIKKPSIDTTEHAAIERRGNSYGRSKA